MPNDKDFLIHYGIFGQRWGVRRFQNEDGTLTEEGKKRYAQNDQTKKGLQRSFDEIRSQTKDQAYKFKDLIKDRTKYGLSDANVEAYKESISYLEGYSKRASTMFDIVSSIEVNGIDDDNAYKSKIIKAIMEEYDELPYDQVKQIVDFYR